MALRSVIDIDVNDARFKAFAELFDKYQKGVDKLPGQWKQANAQQDQQVKSFRDMAAAMMAQNELLHRIGAEEEKGRRDVERTATAWRSIKDFTASTAGNIARAAISVAKIAGLGLLGGGLGIFGLDRLGLAAASMRKTAGGLGTSPGEAKAFGLNFERFLSDPGSVLQAIAGARFDVTNPAYVGLRSAGISQNALSSQNPAEIAVQLMQQLPKLFAGVPSNQIGTKLQALHLDQIISGADVNRYLGASPEERQAQLAHFRADKSRLDVDPKTGRKWQDFTTQMDRAGGSIETSLIRSLVGLADPIDKLSASVVRSIDAFGHSDFLKNAIDKIGKGIEWFAGVIDKPEFQQGVERFADGIVRIGEKLFQIVSWFAPGDNPWQKPAPFGRDTVSGAPLSSADDDGLGGRTGSRNSGSRGAALGLKGLLAMVRALEGSGDSEVSPAGAIGRYQVTPDTARTYGYDPARLTDPAYNERAATAVLKDLAKRYHGNTDEILAGYNAGPGRANRFRAAGDNAGVLPRETQGYLDRAHRQSGYISKVEINDNTGGNVVVSTGQTAVPQ